MTQFSNQAESQNSSFRARLKTVQNSNCIESPLSLIFSGQRMEMDPITASHLDREQAVQLVARWVTKVSVTHMGYPLSRDSSGWMSVEVNEQRLNYFRQIIFSPPSDVPAILEGQAAVHALAGVGNENKRGLYASLIFALTHASIDPYNFRCQNDFQVLPDSINILHRQLRVVRTLFSVCAIAEMLPQESSAVLQQIPQIASEIEKLLDSEILRALVSDSKISNLSQDCQSVSTWPRFCSLDRAALTLKRLIIPCVSKDPARLKRESLSYVSVYGALSDCTEAVLDLRTSCAFMAHPALKSSRLMVLLEEGKKLLEERYFQNPKVEWTPDFLAALESIVVPAYAEVERFCEEAVCIIAQLLPRLALTRQADELSYILGLAEYYSTYVPEALGSQDRSVSTGKVNSQGRATQILPQPLESGQSAVSLVKYRDRSIPPEGSGIEDSPLSFSFDNSQVSAIVGGDNGTGKSTTCLSVLRFYADAQSLFPISAETAAFVPRTSITTFFVESCDTKDELKEVRSRPFGSYDRFLSRVQRVLYEVLTRSDRPAILFDDSIRAFTSNEAALELSWDLLKHFCVSGFVSFFVQQDSALAQLVESGTMMHQWTNKVSFWGTVREETPSGAYAYSLVRGRVPSCSGRGLSQFHGLGDEQLAVLREAKSSDR
jgi:hypothetical protein